MCCIQYSIHIFCAEGAAGRGLAAPLVADLPIHIEDKKTLLLKPFLFFHYLLYLALCAQSCCGWTKTWKKPSLLSLVVVSQALRPTIMAAVPRVLNRLHDKIVQGMLAAGGLKTKLFVKACEAKVGRGKGRGNGALVA